MQYSSQKCSVSIYTEEELKKKERKKDEKTNDEWNEGYGQDEGRVRRRNGGKRVGKTIWGEDDERNGEGDN